MKILSLCWNEPRSEYFVEVHYIGSDIAPEVSVMQTIIQDIIADFKVVNSDIHFYANTTKDGESVYDKVTQVLEHNHYSLIENVPEIAIFV